MISPARPLIAIGTGAALLGLATLHARRAVDRRASEAPAIAAVARRLPAADLALAGAARHLRFPSLEDPGAAFADAPASRDIDPGAAALAPPIELYEHTALHLSEPSRQARPHPSPPR
jgi:hypothetical protein